MRAAFIKCNLIRSTKFYPIRSRFIIKEIKIVGLYDPQDYGLSIDMWSNSDGLVLKKLFKNIDNYNLSKTLLKF